MWLNCTASGVVAIWRRSMLSIHSALSGEKVEALEAAFEGRGYGDLKAEVADVVLETMNPLRERTRELLEDRTELERILAEGAERAGAVAEATLRDVYDRVGFLPAGR